VVGNVMKISGDLGSPEQVVYSVARDFVGGWMATLMSWLVLSSLFAGLLAFQNSAARYFFSLGRARVLPRALDRVNKHGAPIYGAVATSIIAGAVIIVFAAAHKDPVATMFSWFSALAVLAILLVEALVSVSVIVFFRRESHWWKTILAPVLAILGLVLAYYLVMARFGLLAGTVAKGVDPTSQTFGLSTLGWVLVLLPIIVLVAGALFGKLRSNEENADAVADLVS
jgi:amino acid transporter